MSKYVPHLRELAPNTPFLSSAYGATEGMFGVQAVRQSFLFFFSKREESAASGGVQGRRPSPGQRSPGCAVLATRVLPRPVVHVCPPRPHVQCAHLPPLFPSFFPKRIWSNSGRRTARQRRRGARPPPLPPSLASATASPAMCCCPPRVRGEGLGWAALAASACQLSSGCGSSSGASRGSEGGSAPPTTACLPTRLPASPSLPRLLL